MLVFLGCGSAQKAPLRLELENRGPREQLSLAVWNLRLTPGGLLERVNPDRPGDEPLEWLAMRFTELDAGATAVIDADAPLGPISVAVTDTARDVPDGGCRSDERKIGASGLTVHAVYHPSPDGGPRAVRCEFDFSAG